MQEFLQELLQNPELTEGPTRGTLQLRMVSIPPGTEKFPQGFPELGTSGQMLGERSPLSLPGASCDFSGFCCSWSFIPTLCLKSLLKVLWPSLGLSAFFFLAPLEGDSAAAFGPGCPPGPFSALEPLCTTAGAGEGLLQIFVLSETLFHHSHVWD